MNRETEEGIQTTTRNDDDDDDKAFKIHRRRGASGRLRARKFLLRSLKSILRICFSNISRLVYERERELASNILLNLLSPTSLKR